MKRIFVIIATLLLLSSLAYAFDNEREGFVFGGGVGFAPVADWHLKGVSNIGESSAGISASLFAGYGYNESVMFVLQHDGVIHKNISIDGENDKVHQGFTGLVVYYYFGETGNSFFMTSGVGLQNYSILETDRPKHKTDFGYLIGGGYEFAEHLQINFSFSYGRTKTTFLFEHQQLSFNLMYVVF